MVLLGVEAENEAARVVACGTADDHDHKEADPCKAHDDAGKCQPITALRAPRLADLRASDEAEDDAEHPRDDEQESRTRAYQRRNSQSVVPLHGRAAVRRVGHRALGRDLATVRCTSRPGRRAALSGVGARGALRECWTRQRRAGPQFRWVPLPVGRQPSSGTLRGVAHVVTAPYVRTAWSIGVATGRR